VFSIGQVLVDIAANLMFEFSDRQWLLMGNNGPGTSLCCLIYFKFYVIYVVLEELVF
jgi:hypothetical protein